ncbi:hypothetical protein VTK56DRAFT_9557 [Thermocarpiscus australiensis]
MKRSREPEDASSEEVLPAIRSIVVTSGDDKGDSSTLPPASKVTELDLSDNDSRIKVHCSLPPHKEPLAFSSYDSYETHYRDQHANRCLECRKNFPSAHFLGLHLEETHDSFVSVRRERGERTYSCFVEGCERKCSTPQKRKMHLIAKHMYPKNFFFAVTREGIDGRRSLLLEGGGRRRKSSAPSAPRQASHSQGQRKAPATAEKFAASTDSRAAADSGRRSPEQQPDQDMEDLSSAMSALQFVPPSVRFGRGKKAGFAKR